MIPGLSGENYGQICKQHHTIWIIKLSGWKSIYSEQGTDGIILELKVDSSPEDAIRQIENKHYALRFQGKLGERPKYTGQIRAVGLTITEKRKNTHVR